MLKIFFGDMSDAVYNTASYFKYDYEDEWIIDPFVKEMIQDVDKSTVLDGGVIDSPVLGKIPPTGLSGGVKTLILVKFDKDKIFNASTCGDNCAKWLLKIAESECKTCYILIYTKCDSQDTVDQTTDCSTCKRTQKRYQYTHKCIGIRIILLIEESSHQT